MAASSINRETVRDAVYTLLYAKLVTGGITDKTYGYKVDDFATPVSVVVVTNGGVRRVQNFADDTWDTWVLLDVWTFTLASLEDDSWTRANAEDKRDLIEKSIADCYEDNYSNDTWLKLEYDGDTETGEDDVKELGGHHYLIERIPTRVYVPRG